VAANALLGATVDRYGWDGGFALLVAACLAAIVLLAMSILGHRSRAA